MIKNRSAGEPIQGGEDRPRKKLSFRDPEVVNPPKSAPPLSTPGKSSGNSLFNRPLSVSGVMGLGGFSAQGGVPGVSNPSSSPSTGSSSKGITSSPGIHSPSLPSRLFNQYVRNHSPTRLSAKSHSRHSSYDGMENIQEQENFQHQKQQQQHSNQQPHQEQKYQQTQQLSQKQQQQQQHQQQEQSNQYSQQSSQQSGYNQQSAHQNQYPQSTNQNQYSQSTQQNQYPQSTQQNQYPQSTQQNQHPQSTQQNQHPQSSTQQNQYSQSTQHNQYPQSTQQNQYPQLTHQNQYSSVHHNQHSYHQQSIQHNQYPQQSSELNRDYQAAQQNQYQQQTLQKQYTQQQQQTQQKQHNQQQLKSQHQLAQQGHPNQMNKQMQQGHYSEQESQLSKEQQKQQQHGKQSTKTSHKNEQPSSKLRNQNPSSKLHRHHSLSPKRQTHHLDVNPSGRNSDQMLSSYSENTESTENQAMKVVRTVGQAFEVVHKLTIKDKSPSPEPQNDDDVSREGSEDSSEKPKKDGLDSESGQEDLMTLTSDTYNEDALENLPNRPSNLEPLAPPIGSDMLHKNVGETFTSPLGEPLSVGDYLPQAGTPLSVHHELQLLREQLEQQQQQTQAAVAQVHLLRDQLAAETAARLEAQARTHQLLVHNKELLEHIQQLVLQVRDLEVKLQGGGVGGNGVSSTINMPPNPPDLKSELSPSSLSGANDDDASRHSLRAKPSSSTCSSVSSTSSPLSPHLLSQLPPDTPPTPSPTMAAHTFFFPSSLHSSSQLSTLISPLTLHCQDPQIPLTLQQRAHLHQQQYQAQQQQQAMRHRHYHITHEGGLDSEKREGVIDSSRRLPQVPEDSITSTPLGLSPVGGGGGQRGPPNGPITRAASERYSRQETLAQLQRMAWARHTTK